MTTNIDEILQRRAVFNELMGAPPVPDDVSVEWSLAGGVPVLRVVPAGVTATTTLLFLHGGAHISGSPEHVSALAARIASRLGAAAVVPDFRLAPEHPYPADVDDALAVFAALGDPSRVVVASESSGGGTVLSLLLALRERGLAQPAAAYVMSPWLDLTLSGTSMSTKVAADGVLSRESLAPLAAAYAAGRDPRELSAVFADLRGLPPLVIQVGSHEVLLDDAVRLATRAAADDVFVQLDVSPEMGHVFQNRPDQFPDADPALDRAATFLRGHLPA